MSIMFKVNNKDTRRRNWHRSGVFIVNFEHISHVILVFLLLNLKGNSRLGYRQNLVGRK